MLIFKFTKTGPSALVSHVDNLRAVTYLMRRAGVNAQYSQGFNPHIELGFSPPIPLGVESFAEYVSVKTTDRADMLPKLNAVSPAGVSFTAQWRAEVNLAAKFNRAQYRFEADGIGDAVAASRLDSAPYRITYDDRGVSVTKDVSGKIFAAERINRNAAVVTLAAGNDNLRPDRLLLHLMNEYKLTGDYRIVKLAAFADEVPADDFLSQAEQVG